MALEKARDDLADSLWGEILRAVPVTQSRAFQIVFHQGFKPLIFREQAGEELLPGFLGQLPLQHGLQVELGRGQGGLEFMGNGGDEVRLGAGEGNLALVKYEEDHDADENQQQQDGYLDDDDNVPGPDVFDEGIVVFDIPIFDIPDDPERHNGHPGDLHDHEDGDGWPSLGIFHSFNRYGPHSLPLAASRGGQVFPGVHTHDPLRAACPSVCDEQGFRGLP